VYLVNYSLIAVAIVFELFVFVLFANANDGNASLAPALIIGAATAVLLPLITYPFAKTVWAAIDLAARPLDPVEEADAARYDRRDDPN
jgi:hypothetical protein